MPLEGLQLGKYRLLRLIGSGGMGDVYIGLDANINRQVAIKVMRGEVSAYPTEDVNKQARHLFQREMKAIAALDHPYILPLYDYGEEGLHNTTLMYMGHDKSALRLFANNYFIHPPENFALT